MRRTGMRTTMREPREIMSAVRSLKSGSQVYAIANMKVFEITSDEEVMKLIKKEIAFVFASFSAHYVMLELYSICIY